MKILIAGAPKTGNMWLKHILSHLYGIPEVDLSGVPDFRAYLDDHFESFVTHQHFLPKPYIVEWGGRVEASFITMARHPGDLFVSLYFYVNKFGNAWRKAGILGQAPSHGLIGEPLESQVVMDYLAKDFHDECLGKTMAWQDSGKAQFIRYEDLKEKPLATLKGLTQSLAPVPPEKIQQAIRKSQFKSMRKNAGPNMKAHFRKGKTGGWQRWLNDTHCDIIGDVSGDAMARWNYDFSRSKPPLPLLKRWWRLWQ